MAQFIKYVLDGEETIYKWLESELYYNYDNVDVHNILKNVIDDAQLEGSGFIFNVIVDAKMEIYKINDIQASSYLPLPEKYAKRASILNIPKRR